jgi:pilus assembly protein TadC
MYEHLLYELLKHLGPLVESIPDSLRFGRRMLIGGVALVCAIFVPTISREWGIAILILQVLCVVTGGICLLIGAFVFFRRWVWRRQEKRQPVVTSLNLK